MNHSGELALIAPETPADHAYNFRQVVSYIAWIFEHVWSFALTDYLLDPAYPDLFEVWYWYDFHNLDHRIAFFGKQIFEPDVGGDNKHELFPIQYPYATAPYLLYQAFCEPDRLKEYISGLMFFSQAGRLREILSSEKLASTNLHKLWEDAISGSQSTSLETENVGYKGISNGQQWIASLGLSELCSGEYSVSVTKAAEIMQCTEATVYNYCKEPSKRKNILLHCIPCRSGYKKVTLVSIAEWLVGHGGFALERDAIAFVKAIILENRKNKL